MKCRLGIPKEHTTSPRFAWTSQPSLPRRAGVLFGSRRMIRIREESQGLRAGSRVAHVTLLGQCFQLPSCGSQSTRMWWGVFRCDCGVVFATRIHCVVRGDTTSCGCAKTNNAAVRRSARPLYTKLLGVLKNIRSRCRNPNNKCFYLYGERGISICQEWDDSEVFYTWAISAGYVPGLLIDRIDNNRGYGPDNCRFVSPRVSARNERRNRRIAAFGETKLLCEWPEDTRCVVNAHTLRKRIVSGWEEEVAITTAVGGGGFNGDFATKKHSLETG